MTTNPQEAANTAKKRLQERPETRNRYFKQALEQSDNKEATSIVKAARKLAFNILKRRIDDDALAKEVANTLSLHHLAEYYRMEKEQKAEDARARVQDASARKADEIASAFRVEKGSLAATLKRARLFDRSITMEDVKKWRVENANAEKRPTKFNSWVGNRAKEEYQADLFFFDDLKERVDAYEENQEEDPDADGENVRKATRKKRKVKELFNAGLLVVDTFSKKLSVIPMENKEIATLRDGLSKAFAELGGKPKMLYTDAEAALVSNELQEWLRREDIVHNITLRHAPLAERMIGHIKNQIVSYVSEKDMDLNVEDRATKWWDVVPAVVKKYNSKHKSRSTLMTPDNAAKPENQVEVKTNLESIRKTDNPQPKLDSGDQVRVVIKKKFDKGYKPDYTDKVYTVDRSVDSNYVYFMDQSVDPQRQYILLDPDNTLPKYKKKKFMRSELLLVRKGS